MYQMTETEYKFAELIWNEEPIGSGELVKQCAEKFGWKKSQRCSAEIVIGSPEAAEK